MKSDKGQVLVIFILFLLPLVLLLFSAVNTLTAVRSRIRLQNSADAAALTAAGWQAQALNETAEINLFIESITLLQAYAQNTRETATVKAAKIRLLNAELNRLKNVKQDILKRAPGHGRQAALDNGFKTLTGTASNKKAGIVLSSPTGAWAPFSKFSGNLSDGCLPVIALAWVNRFEPLQESGYALSQAMPSTKLNPSHGTYLVPDFKSLLCPVQLTTKAFDTFRQDHFFLFKGTTLEFLQNNIQH